MKSPAWLIALTMLQYGIIRAGDEELSPATRLELDIVRSNRDDLREKAKAPLKEFTGKYLAAVTKIGEEAKAAGKSGLLLEAEASLKEFEESGVPDGESDNPVLAKLEKIYLEQLPKVQKQIQPARVKAEQAYLGELKRMTIELTDANETVQALALKEEAKELAETISKLLEPGQPTAAETRAATGGKFSTDVIIIKATYGSAEKSADVTRRVSEFVASKKNFSANPTDLGVDPHPYKNKRLDIIYKKDGIDREQHRGENETVLHESFAGPHDVKEMEAWLMGTKWRCDDHEIIFGEKRQITSKSLSGTWKPNGLYRISIQWAKEETRRYKINWGWKSFTESGGDELSYERIE